MAEDAKKKAEKKKELSVLEKAYDEVSTKMSEIGASIAKGYEKQMANRPGAIAARGKNENKKLKAISKSFLQGYKKGK